MNSPRFVISKAGHDQEQLEALRQVGCLFTNGAYAGTLEVTIPSGWHYTATDNPRDGGIYDPDGNRRIGVAGNPTELYGDPVILVPYSRYWGNIEGSREDRVHLGVVFDREQGIEQPIYQSKAYPYYGEMDGRSQTNWREQYAAAANDAIAWLNSHYPDWRNPAAYWN